MPASSPAVGRAASPNRRYSIVEPHPSVPSTHYLSTGRGGAGNVTKAPACVTRGVDASGPAARTSLFGAPPSSSSSASTSSRRTYTAGRGGAGNVHPSSERAIFSFDEELERQLSHERHAAPVYHVGRGGAGNKVSSWSSSAAAGHEHLSNGPSLSSGNRRLSNFSLESASSSSTTSSESGADHFNRHVKKSFKKILGGDR
jgi:hypothetical protein